MYYNIKNKIAINFVCLLILLSYNKLQAQDLHFTQFYNAPLLTNPANTGFLPESDYRIGMNYRNQWSSIMSTPYKTVSAYGDFQVGKNKIENGWVGLGILFLNDQAGDGILKSNKIYGSVAYHLMIGNSSLLSAGFQAGYVNKRIDQSKLTYPSQFDGKFFDQTINPGFVFTTNNIHYVDIQTGINYAYFPSENIYFNAGYAILHVNSPKETFFNDATINGRIPLRQSVFMNGIVKLNNTIILRPNITYSRQAKANEWVLGFLANYNLTQAGEKQLLAGLYYRVADAIAPVIGVEINQFSIQYSYDVTLSSLNKYNQYRGASEISLVKKGLYPNKEETEIRCPHF